MKVAATKGHLRGQQPKVNRFQEAHLAALWRSSRASPKRPNLS